MATDHGLAAVSQRQAPGTSSRFSQSDAVPDLSVQEQAALPENTSRRGAVSLAPGLWSRKEGDGQAGVQKHRPKLCLHRQTASDLLPREHTLTVFAKQKVLPHCGA